MLSDKTTNSSCSFQWDAPLNPRGEIKSYNIFIKFMTFKYLNPSACKTDFKREYEDYVLVDAGNEFTFREAFSYASYSIQVQAKNGEEVSWYTALQTCETLPGMIILKTCTIFDIYLK
jgi:hypothetical protein